MRRGAAVVVAAVCTAAGGANQFARAADRTFNVSLVGQLNPLAGAGSTNNLYADLAAEGNLVVLGSVGAGSGVSIINNANPAAPTLHTRYMPAGNENGQFRDVVLRNNIGYFAIDSATTGTSTLGGVHIVDLSNPAAPVRKSVIRDPVGFFNNHDLFLDGNYLYIASNRTYEMKVFNVATPAAPAHVRNIITAGIATDDLHDMTIKNGRMYTSNITNGITQIYDVSNMSTTVAPTLLGQLDVGTRNHSVWPSEDGHLLAVAREDNGGEVQLWNIQNPASPSLVRSIHAADFGIDSFSAHNPIIVGDTLYVSWYQAGLQIFNIRDPQSPIHLGAYDTWAGGNGGPTAPGSFAGGYDGNWGLDVSGGKSRIVLSDFDNGFFTVDATNAFRKVWTNAGNASWQDNARWAGGAGPFPNSSEMTASFTHAAAGAPRTVTVDSALAPATPRVAGIEFVSSLSYTIQPAAGGGGGGGGTIEMVSSDGPARITLLDGGVGAAGVNRILAAIALDDDLLVTNNAFVNAPVAPLELNVINATNRTITFAGTGETALVAANPGFTGSAVLSSGKLTLRHAQALNAQPITASGGVLVLRNNASANYGSDLTVTGGGIVSLSLGNGGAGAGQAHALDDITVAAGATLRLFRNDATTLSAGDVSAAGVIDVMPQPGGGTRATRVAALDIPLGGRVNLGDTSLIVTDTPLAAVEQLVTRAYNFMSWDGSGIATAQPQALQSITTLAVATAGEVFRESFGGFSVSADDVLVMYTYTGDVNFDGLVDGSDYGIIDNYVQFPGTSGYVNGDFNYDGTIDGADYGLIDNAIQLQGDPFPIGGVSAAPMTASAVPEPSIVSGVSALTLATALRGRRSRRRVIRAN
jgi:hypothetical protein